MPRILYVTIIALIMSLCLISCSDSTSSEKGKLTGKITLDGQIDASGITISIYIAEVVPEKVLGINHEYPQVAFPVTDHVYFDHRSYTPIATTTTNPEGIFELTDLPYDKYIITYHKEGWGYNYIYDIELNDDLLDINDELTTNVFELYPVIETPSNISDEYVFLPNHCYYFGQNTNALDGSLLRFKEDSRLLFAPSVSLNIYGDCVFPDDGFVTITSEFGIYQNNASNQNQGTGMILWNGIDIHNTVITRLSEGLSIRAGNSEVRRSVFQNCTYGLIANNVENLTISSNLIIGNLSSSASAVELYYIFDCEVRDNIFSNNYISLYHRRVEANVHGNAFIDDETAFISTEDSRCIFEHNLIRSDGRGVVNSGKSNLEILYNEIEANVCIHNAPSNHGYNVLDAGWTKANNNNLIAGSAAVESNAGYYYPEGPFPLDFKNNYWNVTTAVEIDDLIIDYNDLGLVLGSGVSSVINYIPYRASKLPNAGIQVR